MVRLLTVASALRSDGLMGLSISDYIVKESYIDLGIRWNTHPILLENPWEYFPCSSGRCDGSGDSATVSLGRDKRWEETP